MSDPAAPVIELVEADIPRSEAPSPVPVLENVQWKIEEGSFWAVGAFAGSGKTDLLLASAGLQRPMRGHLALFGKDVRGMSEDELVASRLKVGMIFSTGRLFSQMTVAENIAFPLQYHQGVRLSATDEPIRTALEAVNITHLAHKLPRQMPRALHQRIALARALALSPEVLLVDNPLIGVDQRTSRWWIDFLCAANQGHPKLGRKFTIVIATDDLSPWTDAARNFAIIRERHLEPIGGREQITAASQEIVRDLMASAFDKPQ